MFVRYDSMDRGRDVGRGKVYGGRFSDPDYSSRRFWPAKEMSGGRGLDRGSCLLGMSGDRGSRHSSKGRGRDRGRGIVNININISIMAGACHNAVASMQFSQSEIGLMNSVSVLHVQRRATL